jgi:hypothetical protein
MDRLESWPTFRDMRPTEREALLMAQRQALFAPEIAAEGDGPLPEEKGPGTAAQERRRLTGNPDDTHGLFSIDRPSKKSPQSLGHFGRRWIACSRQ